jgi:pimeloyl-[acyl-carrier protein] methyl ester esterase
LKRPLVMISGWAHPAAALADLAEAFSSHFDVSAFPANPSDPVEISEPAILMGWSLGGMLALETALSCQEKVAALVLVSSTARFCDAPGYPCGTPTARVRAMLRGIRAHPADVLSAFLRACAAPGPLDDDRSRELTAQALSIGTEVLAAGLEYLLRADLRDRLAELRLPVLVLHGRRDMIIPWQASEHLGAAITGSTVMFDEDCGHNLSAERAGWIADAVRTFAERSR